MAVEVHIQMWGPMDLGCSYHWITVGKMQAARPTDTEHLRQTAVRIFDNAPVRPNTNIARLVFLRDGKRFMDIVYEDVYRGRVRLEHIKGSSSKS